MMSAFYKTNARLVALIICVAALSSPLLRSDAVVHRDGWSFDRSQFNNTKQEIEAARQKAPAFPLSGWVDYDFKIARKGWYELWTGGLTDGWPRDLYLDGQNIVRLGTSDPADHSGKDGKGVASTKEMNLYLTEGAHTLRFQRLSFPGQLPSVWELREASGPDGTIRGRVAGSPIIEPGGKMTLKVVGGNGAAAHYDFVLKNLMTGTMDSTPAASVDFSASDEAATKDVEIALPQEGLYQVSAQTGGKLLRPSDLKVGCVLALKRAGAVASSGDVTKFQMAGIFNNDAILQRQKPIPVWGWAAPGDEVTVSLAEQTAKATAGADGRWLATLQPMEAGGPYQLTATDGSAKISYSGIMLGEVWLLSGQSNTGGPLLTCYGGKEAATQANEADVRFAALAPQNPEPANGDRLGSLGWQKAVSGGDPVKLQRWVGITFGFGMKLHHELGVPVGLLAGGRGGTFISTWTSLPTHENNPSFKAITDSYDRAKQEHVPDLLYVNKLADAVAHWHAASAGGTAAAQPSLVLMEHEANAPALNYDQLIVPTAPYAIRGVLWYQGENDSGMAEAYQKRLPAMIGDWRTLWHDDSLPFMVAQIAYGDGKPDVSEPGDSRNAELRDAQFKVTSTLPHTTLVVTHDLVRPTDNVHYLDKLPVGERLAGAALATVYGKGGEYSGPMYHGVKFENGTARISYDHLGGGLDVKGDKLSGFAIAGDDKKWVWADAHVDGDTVVVQSSAVSNPVAVRYAWSDTPCGANLYNKAGLPAGGFRTDDWPGMTSGIEWVEKN